MLAHHHGQTRNGATLARSVDVSERTVHRFVDALTDAMVVRQLQPWHAKIGKRQIKSPRLFIQVTGLLHRLLGLGSMRSSNGTRNSERAGRGW